MQAAQNPRQVAIPFEYDVTRLIYLRRHKWGDKLLRKLSPEDEARFLSEQPLVSDLTSHVAGVRNQRSLHAADEDISHVKKVREQAKHALSRASQIVPGGQSLLAATTTDASDDVYERNHSWVVPGVGTFLKKAEFKFTGNTLPAGLTASDNVEDQGTGPLVFRFDPANVSVSGGTLNLKVPGGQGSTRQPISCAEITTDETAILHASVRMTAKMSGQQGVCHGAFFYRSDNAESDIEYLTDPTSRSNRFDPNSTQFWYSNQAKEQGQPPTHKSGDPPSTVEGYHTYRLDWTAEYTAYYVDGKLQSKLTDNVPDKSGMWVWNNWSNGDPGWSCGPPENDSIFKIKDITMYYNTLS